MRGQSCRVCKIKCPPKGSNYVFSIIRFGSEGWCTVYWTESVIIYRCKEKKKVVFDLEKGGKSVTYVYYTIYFIYWNPSFKRRDRKSELQRILQKKRG